MSEDIRWFDPELGTPIVSVSRTGLTFNSAAVAVLGRPGRVQVGVKPETSTFIVKAEAGEVGSLPFSKDGASDKFVRISSKDLVRFLASNLPAIDLDSTSKYIARMDGDGALAVDVKQQIRPRRKTK